ncbi:MFS transporter [Sphingomonas sp. TF3]|uniref:MFS transporter n=1 Tax=Sphingomonas sp. TF3 TaxID=2495580 RepID=UPI000F86B84C|nr:MFS transporter [Sphingomonas sp. TF3]RUN78398.1 MFS transporter [Sphingomonas sp. TF3]
MSDGPPAPADSPSPLASPTFREIWAANTISNLGSLVQLVGASWLMISLTTSEQMIALVQASTALPLMLLALWGGTIADRFDRRDVMVIAQAFTMIASAALAVAAWAGWLSPWSLLTFTFLIGCGGAMKTPAWQAAVGEMVPRASLPSAIALNSVGFNLARSVGPAIGGLIVAAAGPAAAFVVNALSNIGMLVALRRWRRPRAARTLPRESFVAAIGAGIRYVAMAPAILTVLPRAALFGLTASSVQALLPLIVRDRMHGGALTYGLLLGAFGLGAVAGGLSVGKLGRRWSPEQISRIFSLGFAIGTVGIALSPWLALSLAALALTGAGWLVTFSTLNVTVQLNAPNWVLARALALYQMSAFGGVAAGSWLGGFLADWHGVRDALLVSAALQLAVIAVTRWLPLRGSNKLDLMPFSGLKPIAAEFAPDRQDSPVMLLTEFRIDVADRARFLELMQERRRIRGRNGARRWQLLQDMSDPELWVETIHLPAWSDYLRHRERLAEHEVRLFAQIAALDRGGKAPRVRRFVAAPQGHSAEVTVSPTDLA